SLRKRRKIAETDEDRRGVSGVTAMRFRAVLPMARLFLGLAALAMGPAQADRAGDRLNQTDLAFVNRLTWGETAAGDTLNGKSRAAWLEQQLHPGDDDGLPPGVKAAIAGMEISQKSLEQIAVETREMQLAIRDARKDAKADDKVDDKGEVQDVIKPYR